MTKINLLQWRGERYLQIAVVALLVLVLLPAAAANAPAPAIDVVYGDTTIEISADRAWSIYPGDCVQLRWQLEGIKSLHIDGEGKIGSGEQPFCPDLNRTSPLIEVLSQQGIYRQLRLKINFLPDLVLYVAAIVCVVGSIVFSLYFLVTHRIDRPPPWRWILLAALLLTAFAAHLRLNPTRMPVVERDDGQVALRLWAEQEHLVFPRECTDIGWSVVGAKSLRVNGEPVDVDRNPGRAQHCAWHGNAVEMEFETESGGVYHASLPIPALFAEVAHIPVFYYWCLFGSLLLAFIYVPLAAEKARALVKKRATSDIAVLGAMTVLVVFLYLPFGFDTIPQLETWYSYAYFDGQPFNVYTENFGRFWLRLPHALSYVVDSESFLSFHLLHTATFIAQMAIVYAILRKLNVRSLYALLVATLFMLYPVNSGLLSSRTMIINSSTVLLVLAAYTALDYLENPRRLALAGILLTMLIHVVIYEASLAIVAIMPLIFWLRNRGHRWQNLNLTLLLYSLPIFKIAYLTLLILTNRPFYNRDAVISGSMGQIVTSNVFEALIQVGAQVHRRAFVDGWSESMTALGENSWWLPTLVAVLAVTGGAAYLARIDQAPAPSTRQIAQAMLASLALIIAAIGVFMLLPFYSSGDWRLYTYVPFGAAVFVLCILLLLTSKLKRQQLRDAVIIAASLMLMLPAFSRLLLQHDRLTHSADAKARILYQVLELAPRPHPNVDIVMMTTLDTETMLNEGIFELLLGNTFDSALFTLYDDHAPRAAFLCLSITYCSNAMTDTMVFISDSPEERLRNSLFLELRPDLTVHLIEDPIAFLKTDIDIHYDASQLYDPDAPIPARAQTMLGRAIRR